MQNGNSDALGQFCCGGCLCLKCRCFEALGFRNQHGYWEKTAFSSQESHSLRLHGISVGRGGKFMMKLRWLASLALVVQV